MYASRILEMVVTVEKAWICIILSGNLQSQGIVAARDEVQRLAGDAFLDFRLVDDDYDGDCYAFVKCNLELLNLEKFRQSKRILNVLASYDNPAYLGDDEVYGFVVEDEEPMVCLDYGDLVLVTGDGPYSNIRGIVVMAGCEESLVLFRFHTISIRRWILNTELQQYANVFSWLKFPVTDDRFFMEDSKYPVLEEIGIGSTG